jgi:hypothetical protein
VTAEIAVMNQSAVALAADSAATRSEVKILTANKIFALSKYEPVAAMIYGAASCLGVPWETIIKEFRGSLGSDAYSHVADYGEALIDFISQNRALFPEGEQEQFAFRYAADKYERIRERIRELVREEFARGSMTDSRVGEITTDVIKQREEFWKSCPSRGKLPRDFRRRVRERYGDQIRKAHDEIFEGLRLDSRLRERLMQLTLDSWSRCPQSPETGVVLAGFGRNDMFPALAGYGVDGVLLNRAVRWKSHDFSVDHKSGPVIVPFAQDDMIRLFVEGVTPAYEAFVESYFEEIISGLNEMIMTELPASSSAAPLRDQMEKHRDVLLTSLSDNLAKKRRSLYVNPLLSIVGSLPLDELASLAESLVNLTSLRRRVSLDQETVGGPIDVAVISRGDGLVWIKRKHYFSPELNHQFFSNYYREG